MIDARIMHTIALEISTSALPSWRLLPQCVRWLVGAFPGVSASASDKPPFTQSLIQPAMPSAPMDITETATRLTMAFPRLLRRVMEVTGSGSFVVRLECQGWHEGMWGDIIYPTWRRISFEESHEIVALDGRLVSDRITLDVPGILAQLCSGDSIDPDETARMGRARRDAHERARMAYERSRREIR
jgi:hypothetical protein